MKYSSTLKTFKMPHTMNFGETGLKNMVHKLDKMKEGSSRRF